MGESRAYFNEIDPFAAAWLRELIRAGLIAPGDVDERSIEDVRPDDLAGYTQCHFFAGIGVWSYALRLAGWPDDRPVWTGSCPCQPWSDAGAVWSANKAEDDTRDLWPAWCSLISAARPKVIFSEQVTSRAALRWVDRLFDDLEREGYAVGAIIAEIAALGSPQRRERFGIAADLDGERGQGFRPTGNPRGARPRRWRGEADLRAITERPFDPGPRWPQPLIRSVDDGAPARVGRLRGYGNAVDAEATAAFIESYIEARALDLRLTGVSRVADVFE